VILRRLLFVEDEDIIRSEVTMYLESPPIEISVTACVCASAAFAAIDSGVKFDAALIDLGLPDGRGIDVIRHLRYVLPACAAVVFTIYGDPDTLFEALRSGACGYLLKQTPVERLHDALRDAVAGGAPMSPTIARLVVSSFAPQQDGEEALTAREGEVLKLLAKGHTYADVAVALGIGVGTVQSYVKVIYTKLEISSKAEAAAIALRLGLL